MPNETCYATAIGLSQSPCNCAGAPDDYNLSDSGLYLDELEPLSSAGGYDDCSDGSIWDIMSRSRDEAIRAFIADTDALMIGGQGVRLKRHPFKGVVGEGYSKEEVTGLSTYAGVRLHCARVRSGTLKIRKIGTCFSETGTIAVTVYNNRNAIVGGPYTVNTTAGSTVLTTLATPLELPLLDPYSGSTEYFLVYDTTGVTPRRNKIHCGCGGFKVHFNAQAPYCEAPQDHWRNDKAWANWMMVGGWDGDTLTDFDDTTSGAGSYLNGLFIEGEIYCSVSEVLCESALDFNSDPLAMSSAFAIRWRAGSIMAQKMMLSTKLNRSQMVNRDALTAARREWDARYNETVQYIAQNANLTLSDCVECKPAAGIKVRSVSS
jgi:hypothetical protein